MASAYDILKKKAGKGSVEQKPASEAGKSAYSIIKEKASAPAQEIVEPVSPQVVSDVQEIAPEATPKKRSMLSDIADNFRQGAISVYETVNAPKAERRQTLIDTLGGLKESGVAGLKGLADIVTMQVPKAMTTTLTALLENQKIGFGIGAGTNQLFTFEPEVLEKKRKDAAQWADDLTTIIEGKQQDRLEELGIAPTSTVVKAGLTQEEAIKLADTDPALKVSMNPESDFDNDKFIFDVVRVEEGSAITDPVNFGYKFASGAGSLGLAMGISILTKSPTLAAGALGWLEGSDTYNKAKDSLAESRPDLSEDSINKKALINATFDSVGIALLEKVGLDYLFRSYGGGVLRKAAINSITETAQETSQTLYSNLVARFGYDKTQEIFEGVGETIFLTLPIGFIGGAVTGGGVSTDMQILDEEVPKETVDKVVAETPLNKEEATEVIKAVLPILDEEVKKTPNKVMQNEVEVPGIFNTSEDDIMGDIMRAQEAVSGKTTRTNAGVNIEAEARKYKNAEDFIASQGTIVYRGQDHDGFTAFDGNDKSRFLPGMQGTSFSFSEESAQNYGDYVVRAVVDNNSLLKPADIDADVLESIKSKINELTPDDYIEGEGFEDIVSDLANIAKEQNKGAINLTDFFPQSQIDDEIRVLDKSAVKTTTELENIWKQVNGITDTKTLPNDVQDVLEELQDSQEAQDDWIDNYAEEYGQLAEQISDLQKELKSSAKNIQAGIQEQIDGLAERQIEIEQEFVKKYTAQAEKIVKEKARKQEIKEQAEAVEKAVTTKPVAETEVVGEVTAQDVRDAYGEDRIIPFENAVEARRDQPVVVEMTKKQQKDKDYINKNIQAFKDIREERIARLKELEEKGSLALHEYDRNISSGGDLLSGTFTAMSLVQNHISYANSQIDYLENLLQGIDKGGKIKDDGNKKQDNNSKRGVRQQPDTEGGSDGAQEQERSGGEDNERSGSMARGERGGSDTGSGERSSSRLESDTTESPKTFWTNQGLLESNNKTSNFKKGHQVNLDGKRYEIISVLKGKTKAQNKYELLEKPKSKKDELETEAEGRRTERGTTNASIEELVKSKTEIDSQGVVTITDESTQEELALMDDYTGAGGQERAGAEGRGLLDEYYTPDELTSMTYSVLANLGVLKSEMRVLEPSAGIGAFLSDIYQEGRQIDAYEINETAARILKLQYPDAKVTAKPLEDRFMTEYGGVRGGPGIFEQYDLVVGNPPYGEHRGKYKGMGEEPKITRYEEYFVKRGLDLVSNGGYVAMVLPSRMLRTASNAAKRLIAERADLVVAFRLPNGAFPTTDIGTDLVVWKKNTAGKDRTGRLTTEARLKEMTNDEYFKNNPDNVLGEASERKGRYGMEEFVDGDIQSALDKYYANEERVFAEQQSENDEVVEGVLEDIEDSYKPEVYKETIEKETPIEKVETIVDPKVNKVTTADKELLDLSKYSLATKEDAEMWKYVQPTGELKGAFDREKAFYFKGDFFNRFNYLQGDIYAKLDQLERDKVSEIMTNERYEMQKKELEAILPERMTIDRMSLPPNSRMAKELIVEIDGEEKSLSEHFIKWLNTLPWGAFGESNSWAIRGYVRNQAVRGGDKLQNQAERRTRRIEGDRLFKLFLSENVSDDIKKKVEDVYNQQFNSYVRPDYRQVPLVGKLNANFKGRPLEIRDVQLQGVGFLVNRGLGLLAHDVGVGKTMQSIIAINEVLERGWAKRPLIVTPNPNVYNQWIKEINELLPNAKINLLSNLGGDFKGDLATLEIPEGSISVVTEEGFKKLGFKGETYGELTRDFKDVLEYKGDDMTNRARALNLSKAEEQIGMGIKGVEDVRFFEDLGFDHMTVDEVHNANHIIARAKMDKDGEVSEFRSFSVRPSQFGIKTWLASQYIQKMNNGRNVQLASATPFTNNPLEYYSILSLMARERMKNMGILNVNDFMTAFMEMSSQYEFKANGDFVEKSEVRSFKNYQQFQKLLTEFIDFRDGVEAGVKRPARVSREYIVGETEMGSGFKAEAQKLFDDKRGAGALKAIGELRAIAFSPYLSKSYDGKIPTPQELLDGSPKLKAMAMVIQQTLKDNPEAGHLIYSPVGVEFFPILRNALKDITGLKDKQIEIISGKTSKPKRSAIQEAFNKGDVKIVIGSDAIKEGVNLQETTGDLHILSLPWNFTEVRQVIGRAWRQGNRWPRVRVNTYFTENSIDVFLSQKLQNKEKRYEESLRFKGDELDVGDIDFEEMKLDLITDPVRRVELEYQFKENELRMEKKRKEADQAYEHRRAEEYMKAYQLVVQYEGYLKDDPNDDYYKNAVKEKKERLAEVRKKLQEKGINVDNLDAQLEASSQEIEKLEAQIAKLSEEKQKAVELAQKEEVLPDVRDTDFDKFVREREEENQTFFDDTQDVKMLRATGGFIKDQAWTKAIDRELTQEEQDAIIIGREMFARGQDIPVEILKNLNSGYKKYLDFMDEVKKMEKSARRAGIPFDLTEESGEKVIRHLFDEKEVSFLFKQTQGMLDIEGQEAWGSYTPARSWRNPLIRLVTNEGRVQSATLLHESFHAYVGNFMSKSAKEELFDKVKKNPAVWPALVALRKSYNADQVAEEWLADDFANYVRYQYQQNNPKAHALFEGVQEKPYMEANEGFYQKLLNKIREWVRKVTGAQRIYDDLLSRQRPAPRRVPVISVDYMAEIDGELDDGTRAKLNSIGLGGWFKKDRTDAQAKFLSDLENSELFDEHNRNLIRKDINAFEAVTAQARDIYLKDPNEFEAADAFQRVADTRRHKKSALDKYFSEILQPYYKLKGGSMEKVNRVLMDGDKEAVEYDEAQLRLRNLGTSEIEAYKAVRKAFNTAHQFLLGEMRKHGVPEEEIKEFEGERVGYMPHKWKYNYVVKHQVIRKSDGQWVTFRMDNFKTQGLAEKGFAELKRKNVRDDVRYTLDTLSNLEVDFFTEQRLSFDNLKAVITQAKTPEEVKEQMLGALRNMVKEKGFGRQYLKRTGVRGYEEKEVGQIIANYFAGMNGFVTKMDAGKQYFQVLSTIDARRQSRFYEYMRDLIAYDMANTREWEWLKRVAFIWFLANDISFLAVNSTQNYIVGMGEISKYMDGKQKIIGPEKYVMGAQIDWARGKVTEAERKSIEGLLELGELGGEMVSELMGFKNNPLYTEISGNANKALYKTTAFVEQNVNRVPMFLAARRLFMEQGMGEEEANNKALEVSNDVHFRYGKQNRPKFERGRIGTAFVFYHYMRSFLYQLQRDLSNREFAAFSRKMMYTSILGGAVSLPFAKTLMAIFEKIFGTNCDLGDPEACAMAQEMSWWKQAITRGLPSLTGVDLSGRVGIDLISLDSILDDPNDIRSYLGAVGSILWINPNDASQGGRLQRGLALMQQKRIGDALGHLLPDMVGNLFKSYAGYNWGVRSFAGTPLEDADGEAFKYNTWEAIIKATGFAPTREITAWNAKSKQWEAEGEIQSERSRLRRTIQGMIQRGEYDEARAMQEEAREAGTIGDTTNYMREFGKDTFIKDALAEWENMEHTASNLRSLEAEIIDAVYGDRGSDIQKLNLRKEFAIYRTYGLKDTLANDLMDANTNKEKAEILIKAREEMGEEALREFLKRGRKTIRTASGNDSYILISDDLLDLYKAEVKKAGL